MERSGQLFIWIDGAGLLHAKTLRPDGLATDWTRVRASGVDVRIAETALLGARWRVDLRRFPFKRLDVTSDFTTYVVPTGSSDLF